MSEIQRWRLEEVEYEGGYLVEDASGQYMLHSDHLTSRAADAETIKTLRDSIHRAIVMIEDDDKSRTDRAGLSILRSVLSTTTPKEPTQ